MTTHTPHQRQEDHAHGDGLHEDLVKLVTRRDALSKGTAWFQTSFPGCYAGRWPHIHFEVYSSLAKAVSNGLIVQTSQIALPQAACKKVYATSGYAGSLSNLARTSLSTDNVFSDDKAIHQLATVTGNVKHGFVAIFTIAI